MNNYSQTSFFILLLESNRTTIIIMSYKIILLATGVLEHLSFLGSRVITASLRMVVKSIWSIGNYSSRILSIECKPIEIIPCQFLYTYLNFYARNFFPTFIKKNSKFSFFRKEKFLSSVLYKSILLSDFIKFFLF